MARSLLSPSAMSHLAGVSDSDDAPLFASDRHRLAAGTAAALLLGIGSALALSFRHGEKEEDMLASLHRANGSRARALLSTMGTLNHQLRSKGTFCANRADIVTGAILQVGSADACGKKCLHDGECSAFAFKADDACPLDMLGDGEGNCLLWRDTCEEVKNSCWNQYALVPHGKPHHEPHENHSLSTPPKNNTRRPPRVLKDYVPSVSFSIRNLSMSILRSDPELMQNLHDRLQEAVAKKAGFGITEQDVKLELLPDSDVFRASVTHTPEEVEQREVALNLAASQDFVLMLAQGVSEVPNMQSAAAGPMDLVMAEPEQPGGGEESDTSTPAPTFAAPTPAPELETEGEEKEEKAARSMASFEISGIDVDALTGNPELMASVVAYIKKDFAAQTGLSIMEVNVKLSGD